MRLFEICLRVVSSSEDLTAEPGPSIGSGTPKPFRNTRVQNTVSPAARTRAETPAELAAGVGADQDQQRQGDDQAGSPDQKAEQQRRDDDQQQVL